MSRYFSSVFQSKSFKISRIENILYLFYSLGIFIRYNINNSFKNVSIILNFFVFVFLN